MPDSTPDPLAEAARALDEAVARLEQASQARAPADPSAVNQAALAEAAARIDALILRLNDAAAKPRG